MNSSKRLAVALAGLLGLTLVAGETMAQTGEPPQGKPGMMRQGKGAWQPDPSFHLQKITKRLGLTAEQQEKIKPILDEEAAQMKAIDNEKLTRAERRARMQELRKGSLEKIKPFLTPEQLKKHDAIRERMQEQRKE